MNISIALSVGECSADIFPVCIYYQVTEQCHSCILHSGGRNYPTTLWEGLLSYFSITGFEGAIRAEAGEYCANLNFSCAEYNMLRMIL